MPCQGLPAVMGGESDNVAAWPLPFGKTIALAEELLPVKIIAVCDVPIFALPAIIRLPFSITMRLSEPAVRLPLPDNVRSPQTWYSVLTPWLSVIMPGLERGDPGGQVAPGFAPPH